MKPLAEMTFDELDEELILHRSRFRLEAPSIYFAQGTEDGLIKIGISEHPKRRAEPMFAPDAGNKGCRVLATMDFADYSAEKALHGYFAAERSEFGEWFHPSERLLSFIARHNRTRVTR